MGKNKAAVKAKADPHERTEKLFDQLIQQAESQDTKLLLQGMCWLGVLVEEISVGLFSDDARPPK